MTRLLLPLEHSNPAAEHHADDALLHALKHLCYHARHHDLH